MDKRNSIDGFDESAAEELKRLRKENERYREIYGKEKNWPEIEKILLEDVGKKIRKTSRVTDYLKSVYVGQGDEDEDEAGEALLSRLHEGSLLRQSDFETGLEKGFIERFDDLINELFTRKQVKNRKYFKAFLTCDDMESVAKRAGCSKQYIQTLFHKKAIEFVNSPKFIAIMKNIGVKYRVILKEADEILESAIDDLESAAKEAAWDRYEKGQIPNFEERAKKIETEINFELSGTLKDFTPGKLKEMIPCGIDKESTDGR